MNIRSSLFLFISLLAALLIGLGDRPVYKIQEVRVAETAREMLVSGDWLVPRYNGDLRLQKPPLPYWLTTASYVAGGVSAFTTRLPSVLFGLFSALLIWLKLRRELDLKAASNSALILVTSYIGLRYFRSGEADAVLLFFISLACISGYDILRGWNDAWKRMLFGLALGLGFLSKGPAALAIPIATLLSFAALKGKSTSLPFSFRHLFSLAGVLLLLGMAFGWYVWIIWKFPDITQQFLSRQVDETFISGTHPKPPWWYLAHFFEFFAPWGILILPAAWISYQQRYKTQIPPIVRFSWLWLAVVFVLLTATVNKQMQYALLFLPPLSIILGHYLANIRGETIRVNRVLFGLFSLATLAGIYTVMQHSPNALSALAWITCPIMLLILNYQFKDDSISFPVFVVATVTATAFLFSETYLSKEPKKLAAQSIMLEATKHSPLFQPRTPLNDGSLSFYAGFVVPPVEDSEIYGLLEQHPEIWMVGGKIPDLKNVTLNVIAQSGELKLYKVSRP